MSGASNTSDIDEDHRVTEKDRYHVSRGGCTHDSLRRLSDKCILTIWQQRRRSRVTDKSRGECAGCCTCWVDVLLDTGSNEPLGIINYAILWARAALQRHSFVLVENTRILHLWFIRISYLLSIFVCVLCVERDVIHLTYTCIYKRKHIILYLYTSEWEWFTCSFLEILYIS